MIGVIGVTADAWSRETRGQRRIATRMGAYASPGSAAGAIRNARHCSIYLFGEPLGSGRSSREACIDAEERSTGRTQSPMWTSTRTHERRRLQARIGVNRLDELGWVRGFEPPTSGATVRRSALELHPPYGEAIRARGARTHEYSILAGCHQMPLTMPSGRANRD
jgi:hypothetical protein